MKVFAGIDGGGTRTRLALVDGTGALMGFAGGGSCSFADHGLEKAQQELSRVWHEAWTAAQMPPRPADALFMGMGSILSSEDARTNRELAVKIGLADPKSVFADNDVWNAHASGLAGRPGILLISGTGSACLGRNARGETWRAGGWGHLLDDAGSAYALGNAAMIAATRDVDGRGQPTALTVLVCDRLGLRDLKEIFRRVHHEGVSRAEVAALAPDVVGLAEKGDVVARQILTDGARGLMEMVVTVARRLGMDAPALALTGGLITNATAFRKMFLENLTRVLPRFTLAESTLAPVFGAVLLAFERGTGAAPSEPFLKILQTTSARCAHLQ